MVVRKVESLGFHVEWKWPSLPQSAREAAPTGKQTKDTGR